MAREIDTLRDEVKRLRRAATKKISRLKSVHDVTVSGTEFDPRRPPRMHENYSKPQLERYRVQLAEFVSRQTQYVPDADRRPIPRHEWAAYRALERQYNASVSDYFANVMNITLPSGETIAQRMAKMIPAHRQMYDPSVNSPYMPPERSSTAVASRKSLAKLVRDMEKRTAEGYFDKLAEAGMEQFDKMMDVINESDLQRDVKGLTSGQFAALWNYTSFPTAVSIDYNFMLKMLSAKEKPYSAGIRRDAVNEYRKLVKWAKGLDL